ncbi:AzlC family ABC transporter permease [Cellulosilyticum sp. ST5]|uniref:AzlC family ABC transporter permease n=1 Tax=unclassified Cellulosilyticum TaxID=2643091 RepID=UPI000F8D7F92|nr:AzlC family ABC transporter permease [Cellulosilyticum sp. WCF-2]QEH67368.1 branched-chain amino acid ABC transporter permease [Cellulosilyticum sp. WCF-2]
MNTKKKALKAAIPHTIPVLAGFIFLGIAYGVLMASKGYGALWSFLMSTIAFCGSMQFVAITLLTSTFAPVQTFILTLLVNARHLFYGISMLKKYRGVGRLKPFLIFMMCDETFSVNYSVQVPEGVDKGWFYFFISFLNYSYWALGSVLGGLLGNFITFNTEGLDFSLTALFVVIFLDQWKERKNRVPALLGVGAASISLVIFGPSDFIIPAMILILASLTLLRRKLDPKVEGDEQICI